MDGSSGARSSNKEDFEDHEVIQAAFILCSMKNSRPDPEDMPELVPSVTPLVANPRPPAIFNGIIGECSEPYERQLTLTDIKASQNRLNIRKDFARTHLEPMLRPSESLQSGIQAKAYDSERKEYEMTFKIWGEKSHVLNGGWNRFVLEHGLEVHDKIKLWMFRHSETEKLCFVILKKPRLPIACGASVQPKSPENKRR